MSATQIREAQLVNEIGSQKMLRVERWKDEWKHWRAGVEWYGENEYEFICEYPTLLECLEKIKDFLDGKIKDI